MEARPARLWVIDSMSSNWLDPVRMKRPIRRSESTTLWRYEKSSGARWTSSRMAPSDIWRRKARGSSVARERVSGSSSEKYGRAGARRRESVVFPDWRGPVIVRIGKPASRLRAAAEAMR